ncbi:MAG TPA: hypothetical protein VMF11_16135 [Candidatus Baltobacteraceae bacterium]|nr:hypothetical protein [Candidatus Baltobacteraceae bacterium]
MAFYEPLHELLHDMTVDGIRKSGPASWDSGHPAGAPYFEEFTPLIKRRGVTRYDRAFAFDRYFIERDALEPKLFAYLSSLIELARRSNKTAVFKFCRSLGRVAWMRAHFPRAFHLGIVRDPIAQWNSARRRTQSGDVYFLAAPLAILARNQAEPMVALTVAQFGLRLPSIRGRDFEKVLAQSVRFVESAPAAVLYRSFLAFWLVTACKSLPYTDATIDADALARSALYRKQIERTLEPSIGLEVNLEQARTPTSNGVGFDLEAGEIEIAHRQAAGALTAIAASLGAQASGSIGTVARKLWAETQQEERAI